MQFNSFNENLSACKANRSSGVARISVNPNKKSTGGATISINPARHTSRANASGEDDINSDNSQGETDMCKAKRKHLSSKRQKSKTQVRDIGENHQPPEENELSLYGGSDLDDQIDRLVDTLHIANAKGGCINDEGEDDLIKDIENDLGSVEQTGEPIGSNLAKVINNIICTPINKDKLVKKLESHPRPENLDSLKVKKYNTEIWSEMLQSKTRSKDLKTQKLQDCILKAVGVISKVTDTLINLKNNKNLVLNSLRNSTGPMINDSTDSVALISLVDSSLEQTH